MVARCVQNVVLVSGRVFDGGGEETAHFPTAVTICKAQAYVVIVPNKDAKHCVL